jgi:hypothetical protein
MRKMLTLCLLMHIAVSCNNPAGKEAGKPDSASGAKPAYAYTIKNPDNWETGSSQNTAVGLSSLKAFENNKIDECVTFFADTVKWRSDYLDTKFSKDSLKAMLQKSWDAMTSLKIDMHDFESVISKDKKDAYVTMWYVQTVTDKKGKIDSVAVINDLKIVNGKITELDEAIRHFPVKK